MLGRKERDQLELLITGSLRQLIPDDHVLVGRSYSRPSWLGDEVADYIASTMVGPVSIRRWQSG